LEFQADLDQEDYKFVKPDQSTEIILDAYPQDKFIGKVQSVPSYVDEDSATKTFKLKITLENKLFLFPFIIAQSIRGAGYFNGGFILIFFIIVMLQFNINSKYNK
jgi:hypothetical protein